MLPALQSGWAPRASAAAADAGPGAADAPPPGHNTEEIQMCSRMCKNLCGIQTRGAQHLQLPLGVGHSAAIWRQSGGNLEASWRKEGRDE